MGKIIRDPIHNIIKIDDTALRLIDTYAFQRLRRIRQLGIGWMVYPAAEHSRFTHSLGVYGMGRSVMLWRTLSRAWAAVSSTRICRL